MGFFENLINKIKELISLEKQSASLTERINQQTARSQELQSYIDGQQALVDGIVAEAKIRAESQVAALTQQSNSIQQNIDLLKINISELQVEKSKAEDELKKQEKKVHRISQAYKSAAASIEAFRSWSLPENFTLPESFSDIPELVPTVTLALHSDDIQDLRKQLREINKTIDKTLSEYEKRYTTKANLAIYRLMVIALKAELQNILYSLKYGKVEEAVANVKTVTQKYLQIAAEGNQSIAGTLAKFIGEIEYLFIEAVKVEYEYYIRKERIKEEQRAIREQMRQEAEERKQLEQQRKQIEKEEGKYASEIEAVTSQLADADETKKAQLEARIAELEAMMEKVKEKKAEIVHLQNGQAGYVYIISNIGSFGEGVFKIGMTRRLEPMERINELGDASVPFPFDVHGMVFSDNAATLETKLHRLFEANRVNKINARKEFFRVSIDEIERVVLEHDPTAEFTRTALAEQYRQTLSLEAAGIEVLPDEEDISEEVSDNE